MTKSDHRPPAWVLPVEAPCAAIAALLQPHAEVVLHDLERDVIVAIWNPMPGRSVGDGSLLDELPASWRERPVQGPYRKVTADGRELSAVSAVVRDHEGVPRGLLCVNFDRTPLLDVVGALTRLAAPVEEAPPELMDGDWREQIALTVDRWCREHAVDRRRLARPDRLALVAVLDELSLFSTRNAAEHVALALGVSRANVYTLLKETRRARTASAVPS